MQRQPIRRILLGLLVFALLKFGISAVFLYVGQPADLRMSNLGFGVGMGIVIAVTLIQSSEAKDR
jgi:hypothetical protein